MMLNLTPYQKQTILYNFTQAFLGKKATLCEMHLPFVKGILGESNLDANVKLELKNLLKELIGFNKNTLSNDNREFTKQLCHVLLNEINDLNFFNEFLNDWFKSLLNDPKVDLFDYVKNPTEEMKARVIEVAQKVPNEFVDFTSALQIQEVLEKKQQIEWDKFIEDLIIADSVEIEQVTNEDLLTPEEERSPLEKLRALNELVSDDSLEDLSLEQLEDLNDFYELITSTSNNLSLEQKQEVNQFTDKLQDEVKVNNSSPKFFNRKRKRDQMEQEQSDQIENSPASSPLPF